MSDILLLYASKHGHTVKIAHRIAQAIRDDGREVDVHDSHSADDVSPQDYREVIVGASIHIGHHQREIVDWAKHHATALNGMPTAFFSVSLTAAEDDEESRAMTRKFVDDFVEETGWTPSKTASFAGALQYREYDFFTRTLIRLMMKREGHPTDTSRDYDYTDWDAVDRFGHELARSLTA